MKKAYWSYWSAAILFFASFYTLLIPLPLYLVSLKIPDWQLTLILGGFGIASIIIRPLSGILADNYGYRNIMLLGSLLLAAGASLTSFATNPIMLFCLRFTQAAGYVTFTTSVTAKIANMIEVNQRSKALAWFGTAANISMTITPAAINMIMPSIGYEGTFFLAGGLALLPGVLTLLIGNDKVDQIKEEIHFKRILASVKRLKTPLFTSLIFGFGFGTFLQFLPLLIERKSLGKSGLYYTIYGICLIITRIIMGPYLDKQNRYNIMFISFFSLSLGLGILAFIGSNFLLVCLGIACISYSCGILHPLLISIHVEEISMVGLACAVFYLGFDSGIGLGALFLSPIIEYFNISGVFITASISALVGIFFVSLIRKEKKAEPIITS